MSSIVTSLTGGHGAGMAYQPSAASVVTPATPEQANTLWNQTQQGLTNQQSFVDAVKAQNGLQNQSSVFNQMQGVANGTGPNPAQAMLANSTGANTANQAALMAGQRGSGANSGLLARQAAMQGANNQQNAAGQAAALQANQQLGALNQMGGLATNQANQQANATNAYTNAALQAQQNTLGGINNQNQANVAMQSNMNNVSGALAGGVAGQQGNMMGNMMGGMGGAMNLFGKGSKMFGGASDAAGTAGEVGTSADTLFGGGEAVGGAAELGSNMMMAAKGGMIPKLADGGQIANSTTELLPPPQVSSTPDMSTAQGPQSNAAKQFAEEQSAMNPTPAIAIKGTGAAASAANAAQQKESMQQMEGVVGQGINFGHNLITGDDVKAKKRDDGSDPGLQWDWGGSGEGGAKGAQIGSSFGPWGTLIGGVVGLLGGGMEYKAEGGAVGGKPVPALVSPGEKYLDPKDVKKVAEGKADPLTEGKTIPGKPKVDGAKNSYANDTVPVTLEEGGIILPRSVTMAKNAPEKASEFVAAIMKRNKAAK